MVGGVIIKMNSKEKNLEMMKPEDVLSTIVSGGSEGVALERALHVQICALLKGKQGKEWLKSLVL